MGGLDGFNQALQLSFEQQFNMEIYARTVEAMHPDQMREIILELSRQLMIKDNVVKHLMSDINV